MASGPLDRGEPLDSATVSGVLSDQLHQPFGVGADRQAGFPAVASNQHAVRRLAAASGPRRVRQRVLRHRGDGLWRAAIAPGADTLAGAGISLPRSHRSADPLLADVSAGRHQLLDGARAGNRVGLLQPLQHRTPAGRGISRRVPRRVYVRYTDAAGIECPGARAGGFALIALANPFAAGNGCLLFWNFGLGMARGDEALHECLILKFYKPSSQWHTRAPLPLLPWRRGSGRGGHVV